MKKYITLVFLILFASGLLMQVEAANNTLKFITLGNCDICKNRIQTAVKTLPGIISVEWSVSEHVTTVTFEESLVDVHIIMKKIASVGHDTEWYQAPFEAYSTLIGSCCEYKRTIDYSTVKIGYLSLMGIWVSVNDIQSALLEISVFPTVINEGIVNISFKNINSSGEFSAAIYSINGCLVYSCNNIANSQIKINLSSISKGDYIIFITDRKKVVSRTKIVVLG